MSDKEIGRAKSYDAERLPWIWKTPFGSNRLLQGGRRAKGARGRSVYFAKELSRLPSACPGGPIELEEAPALGSTAATHTDTLSTIPRVPLALKGIRAFHASHTNATFSNMFVQIFTQIINRNNGRLLVV